MNVISFDLDGVMKIEAEMLHDARGWFSEGYNKKKFAEIGIDIDFIQDNFSFTEHKGTIRGMHYQEHPYEQAKLFRCIKGELFDVVVDLRRDSPHFLQWKGYILKGDKIEWLFIPRGFAHGFQTLTDDCLVQYKVDNYFNKNYDRNFIWNDDTVNIKWKYEDVYLSVKDRNAPAISDILNIR